MQDKWRDRDPAYKAHQELRELPGNFGTQRSIGVAPNLDMAHPHSIYRGESFLYFTARAVDGNERLLYRFAFRPEDVPMKRATELAWEEFKKARPGYFAAMERGQVAVMLQHEAFRGELYTHEFNPEAWGAATPVADQVHEVQRKRKGVQP